MGSFFSAPLEIGIRESDIGIAPECANTVDCVVDLIRSHKGRVVIVTGAGISSHQLPTFRSNNNSGLWESYSPPIQNREVFYSNPKPSWKLCANVRNMQVSNLLHPSLAHHVIHLLLQRGYVSHVITQNIDGLHSFPGDERRVIELHGAVGDFGICERCGVRRSVDNLLILQKGECPTCSVCGAVLKPNVAFFGDAIDTEKRRAASAAVARCEVLVLVGTHCTVDPVQSMATEARKNGTVLVEINITKTIASAFVNVTLEGHADDVFREIAEKLLGDVDLDKIDIENWNKF